MKGTQHEPHPALGVSENCLKLCSSITNAWSRHEDTCTAACELLRAILDTIGARGMSSIQMGVQSMIKTAVSALTESYAQASASVLLKATELFSADTSFNESIVELLLKLTIHLKTKDLRECAGILPDLFKIVELLLEVKFAKPIFSRLVCSTLDLATHTVTSLNDKTSTLCCQYLA